MMLHDIDILKTKEENSINIIDSNTPDVIMVINSTIIYTTCVDSNPDFKSTSSNKTLMNFKFWTLIKKYGEFKQKIVRDVSVKESIH